MRMARDMRAQLKQLLRDGELLHRWNNTGRQNGEQRGDDWELVKAVLVAGLYPNLARVDTGRHKFKTSFFTRDNGKVQLHPGR